MYVEVNERLEVWARFAQNGAKIRRLFFRWKGHLYGLHTLTFHHEEACGEALVHHFSLMAAPVKLVSLDKRNGRPPWRWVFDGRPHFFELAFNSREFTWILVRFYELD
jgi:hypothetical protein